MTARPELNPGERLDSLGIKGWRIIQHTDEFRFSVDAVLLAHFATIKPACIAADLGCGTGAVALFLLARGCSSVYGIELEPRLVSMAQRTAKFNALDNRFRIIQGDIRTVRELGVAGAFDLVTANPPYRLPGTGRISPKRGLARACHETEASLDDFVKAAAFLLKFRGRLALIHLPERLPDLFVAMRSAGFEPKRMQLVQPLPAKAPTMVLVEAVRGARSGGLTVLPSLIQYRQSGVYSEEILAYYR